MQNVIIIERYIDGFVFIAKAFYVPSQDGWVCRVKEKHDQEWTDERGPDESGGDAFATLIDMIDLALDNAKGREANGPQGAKS